MMLVFKKIGLFIKKYWQVILLVVTTVVGVFLLKKRPSNFIDDFLKIKKIHEDEIKKIEQIRKKEEDLKKSAKEEHERNVAEIKAEADLKQAILDKEKQDEIDRLSGLNTSELAEEVSKQTGFKVILPKDEK